jgi:hypothetical protein
LAGLIAFRVQKLHADDEDVPTLDDNPGMLEISATGERKDQVKSAREAPGVWIWGSNRLDGFILELSIPSEF